MNNAQAHQKQLDAQMLDAQTLDAQTLSKQILNQLSVSSYMSFLVYNDNNKYVNPNILIQQIISLILMFRYTVNH